MTMTVKEWEKIIKQKLTMFSAGRDWSEQKSADAWQTMFNHYSDRDVDPEIDKYMTAQEYNEWARRQK